MIKLYKLLFVFSFLIQSEITLAVIPPPSHVVVLVLENHSYEQIYNSPAAPYMNGLISDPKAALFTQSYGLVHPSQPNYIQLFSGSTQGVTDNLVPNGIPFTTPNLGAQLIAASKTFIGYSDSLPFIGFTGASYGDYQRKHNPWVNWQNSATNGIPSVSNAPFTSFPANYNLLPTVSFVVPNQAHDMHDGSDPARITVCDNWIQANLGGYIQWAKTNNSLLIITFDEDDSFSNQHIFTLFIGEKVQHGNYPNHIDHYNVLRMLEDIYNVPYAGAAASAATIDYCWIKCDLPALISANGPTTFCTGDSVTLSASEGVTYLWSNGNTNSSINVNTSGDYSVTITDANNCTATSAPTTVTVNNFSVTTTLFTENIGSVSVNTSIANHETNNGFVNDNFTMTGTADIRNSSPSSGYSGASGAGNVFFNNMSGRNFIISGINTMGLSNLKLSFGIFKNTVASTGSDFSVKVSSDGVNYTNLSFVALTSEAMGWFKPVVTGNIPSTANLRIQFIQNGNATQYRIDDIKLTYEITSATITASGVTSFCQGNSVHLNSVPASSSYYWSNGNTTQNITATSSGNYFIVSSSSNGCKDTSNIIPVTVTPLPQFTSFNPNYAMIGDTISIYGNGFSGISSVNFNGVTSVFNSISVNELSAIVPTGATSGPVTITNSCDTDTTSSFYVYHDTITIHIKVLIEAFYDGSGKLIELLGQGTCDSMSLDLHSANSPHELIFSSKSTIDTSGLGSFIFPDAITGEQYYLAVHGRNSLKTWSSTAVTLNSNSFYDFSDLANRAYGNNLVDLNDGYFAIYSGDVNSDEKIDLLDIILIQESAENFDTGYIKYDLNGDHFVESADYSLIENNALPVFTLHP